MNQQYDGREFLKSIRMREMNRAGNNGADKSVSRKTKRHIRCIQTKETTKM